MRYAGFIAGRETCTGTIRGFRWQEARAALDEVRTVAQAVGLLDDATSVVVHRLFGGEARQSPLHVAGLTETAHAVQEVFPRGAGPAGLRDFILRGFAGTRAHLRDVA